MNERSGAIVNILSCACLLIARPLIRLTRFPQLGVLDVKSDPAAVVMAYGADSDLFPAKCDFLSANQMLVGWPDFVTCSLLVFGWTLSCQRNGDRLLQGFSFTSRFPSMFCCFADYQCQQVTFKNGRSIKGKYQPAALVGVDATR